jgi:hypothetical protein
MSKKLKSPYRMNTLEIQNELKEYNVSFDHINNLRDLKKLLIETRKKQNIDQNIVRRRRNNPRRNRDYNPNGEELSLRDLYIEALSDTERVVITPNRVDREGQSDYGYIGIVSGSTFSHQGAFKMRDKADVPKVVLENLKEQKITSPHYIPETDQGIRVEPQHKIIGGFEYEIEQKKSIINRVSVANKYSISKNSY